MSSAPGSFPPPLMQYQVPAGQVPNPALRPFAPIPNGYAAVPGAVPQGTMPPPGGLFLPFLSACIILVNLVHRLISNLIIDCSMCM